MGEMLKRTLSGFLYILLIIVALFSNSMLLYRSIFSIIVFVAVFEYSNLTKNNVTRPFRSILDGMAAVYIFCLLSSDNMDIVLFLPYLSYLIYVFVRSIYTETKDVFGNLSKTLFGQLYIGGSLSMANMMFVKHDNSFILIALIFFCIWANDTGAYLIGCNFGKKRLFPSVSPKKSWEGFWGGFFFSVITSLILNFIGVLPESITLLHSVVIGCIISVFATFGDLFESALKRNIGVKDSGNIIPGHGGILDRIDSLLFALPAVVLYLYAINSQLFS